MKLKFSLFIAFTISLILPCLVSAEGSSLGLDDFYVSDFTTYNGPNLEHINSFTTDNKGNESKSPMFLDNEITAAYLLNKESLMGIGPSIRFNYTPVLGKGFDWNDVGLKFIDYRAIKTENFRLAWNFYIIAPTAKWLKAAGMDYALKTTPYAWYSFPNSNFMVGAWTEIKDYAGVNYGTQLKLYYGPYVNYKISKSFSLNFLYEDEYHHNKGMSGTKFQKYKSDIQPGFVWVISRNVLFNPYVEYFLNSSAFSNDKAALGAVINIRFL